MSLRVASAALASLLVSTVARAQCHEFAHDFALSGLDGRVRAMATYDDGQGPVLYVGGDFLHAGEQVVNGLARWDGTHWTPRLGDMVGGTIRALAVYDDGSGPALYASGSILSAGGQYAYGIAKWDGTSWSRLVSGGVAGTNGTIHALCVYDDGTGAKLYAGGQFHDAGGQVVNNLARWGPNGWEVFSAGIAGFAYAMTLFDDGSGQKLAIGGDFPQIGGVLVSRVATWDGSAFAPLGAGVNNVVWSLKTFHGPSGPELVAGGDFTHASGTYVNHIASWRNGAWSALAGGVSGVVNSLECFDEGAGERLFVGGNFSQAGGLEIPRLARWDGTSWDAPGGGDQVVPTAQIPGLGLHDDGTGLKLYVGTDVRYAPSSWTHGIGRWNGSAFERVGPPRNNLLDGIVSNFAIFDDGTGPALHATGAFTRAGGDPVEHIARWTGARWRALGGGLPGGVAGPMAAVDHGSGPRLYAAVAIGSAGSGSSELRRWDGSAWSTIASTTPGSYIRSLCAYDEGSGPALYVGGTFQTLGGVNAERIARFDGSSWSAVGGGMTGSHPSTGVLALSVQDYGFGPALIAGGRFDSAGGQPALNIASWNGINWSGFGAGIPDSTTAFAVFDEGSGPALFAATSNLGVRRWYGGSWSWLVGSGYGLVTSLAVLEDGDGPALFLSGDFDDADVIPSPGLARWNGTRWSGVAGGVMSPTGPGDVRALQVFDDGTGSGPDLFVGGNFTICGGVLSPYIGRWHACAGPIASFCHGDGADIPCPCWNDGAAGHGCANSANPAGAHLGWSGSTNPDALVLHASGELPNALSIFLQGREQTGHTPFGDGLRCASGWLLRLYAHGASGGSVQAPLAGEPSITARSAALADSILPGTMRFYQVYYRDPQLAFCQAPSGASFNVTNGLVVHW